MWTRSAHRELFLSVEAPIRPLSPGRVSGIVRERLTQLGIDVPRRGAHCLRHANARHLLDAGFALKEIGDQLGHRSASTTRIYAKVETTDFVVIESDAELVAQTQTLQKKLRADIVAIDILEEKSGK